MFHLFEPLFKWSSALSAKNKYIAAWRASGEGPDSMGEGERFCCGNKLIFAWNNPRACPKKSSIKRFIAVIRHDPHRDPLKSLPKKRKYPREIFARCTLGCKECKMGRSNSSGNKTYS